MAGVSVNHIPFGTTLVFLGLFGRFRRLGVFFGRCLRFFILFYLLVLTLRYLRCPDVRRGLRPLPAIAALRRWQAGLLRVTRRFCTGCFRLYFCFVFLHYLILGLTFCASSRQALLIISYWFGYPYYLTSNEPRFARLLAALFYHQ